MMSRISNAPGWIRLALITSLLLSVATYLLLAQSMHSLGFPLDDAWIHQTYARNLARNLEWSFQAGQPSGGSTAPLWTSLIAIGHWLGAPPLLWSSILGAVILACTGWVCSRWLQLRLPRMSAWGWIAALLILYEWHLVWASLSGMETLLQSLLFAILLWRLERGAREAFWLGALVGVGVWLRPDAVTLLLPIALMFLLRSPRGVRGTAAAFGLTLLGLAALLIPYLLFNYSLNGTIWPSTFYAKQAEYAVLREANLGTRMLGQLIPLLPGAMAVLLPGIFMVLASGASQRRWDRLVPLVWAAAFLFAYALRLPVTYQHGRYAIPTLPVLLILGLEGLLATVDLNSTSTYRRLLSRVWILALPAVSLVFWWMGARAFGLDVAIIETEMVDTAEWISQNTEQEALIAAHDIGALGYFGERRIVDLAGLVSPEVIPILRDESALAGLLDARRADYLMTFPDWYPELARRGELVYTSGGSFSPRAGGSNMAVYLWRFAPESTSVLYSPQSERIRDPNGNDSSPHRR